MKRFLRGTHLSLGRNADFNKSFDLSQPENKSRLKLKSLNPEREKKFRNPNLI